MSSAPESTAPLPSFLERFLEDRSIKWMLGLGMLVLLGSSLKFVTHHWESYSPFWKYLVLMAYAAAVYGLAEIGLHRLQLRRTGTGLMALTLSLLPLTFLSLRWVAPGLPTDISGLVHDVGLAALLCANLTFTAFASRRILRTLLHRVPVTYWLCYLTLCVSGALAPAVPVILVPIAATALWAVFTLGVVKVNRHVFWLAEEERWPRIFAFFPTALLAAQFVLLFALNFAPDIATPWLGLGLTLVAVPVLLTADAAAAVFQQRSGVIVYPWPTTVIAPLLVGLGLCAAGIGLALSGLPRPIALSPTAALSALCLWAVARRTGHRVFTWAMLLCLLTAYQFLPVYFQQFARQVVQTSAEMVHERRLPYAFYGITYAPFILALLVAGRWLKAEFFAAPCRQLAVGLAMVMLVASWTDAKAMFIAGGVLTVLWLLMRLAFGNKRLDWGIGITWLSAAAGLEVFLRDVCQWAVPIDCWWWTMAAAAGVLGVASVWQRDDESTYPVFERLSLLGLGVLVYRWMWQWGLEISPNGTASLAGILTLVAGHQARRAFPFVGEGVLAIAGWGAARYGLAVGIDPLTLWLVAVVVAATGWAASQAVTSLADRPLVQAFGFPLRRVSTLGLAASQLAVLGGLAASPAAQITMTFWLIAAIVSGWSFAAAGRTIPVRWVQLGCISSLMLIGRGLEALCGPTVAVNWLPVLWGSAVVAAGILARRIVKSSSDTITVEVAQSADELAQAIEWLLAIMTLGFLAGPARFAAALSLGSLAWRSRRPTTPWSRHALLELGFLQVAATLLSIAVPQRFLWLVPVDTWQSLQIVATLLAAVWLFALQSAWWQRFLPDRSLLDVETTCWELIAGFSTVTLLFTQARPMDLIDAMSLMLLFGMLTASGLRSAVGRQNADTAWMSLMIAGAGIGYLVWFDVVAPFHPVTLGGLLATSLLLSSLGERCRKSSRYGVLAQPFSSVGAWLPAAVAVLCISGAFTNLAPHRPGIDSLIVLAAAAIYFMRWIERRDTVSLLAAITVFNAAQMLLWRQLAWSDPQLYLMPLGLSLIALAEGLPRELKIDSKTALRYAGALVILVSPLFHILDGGWLPLLTLMAASLGVSVLALGLKSRPLLYSGTAFLVADLAALVVRGSLERTDILWIAGIGLGSSVIALAAYCENHRELVLQRMRLLTATLQTWD